MRRHGKAQDVMTRFEKTQQGQCGMERHKLKQYGTSELCTEAQEIMQGWQKRTLGRKPLMDVSYMK